ncbi:hypothetical protein TWF173_000869 [Orbilia oligospora]|nr:hypothetical protein TWF173_000869 [Orbilia oligospora]
MDSLKRPWSGDGYRDDGRDCKHPRHTKTADGLDYPIFDDLHDSSPLYDSIRNLIHDVPFLDTADIDMAYVHPEEESNGLHEVVMVEQPEASFTIQESLSPSKRASSPTKRRVSLTSQNDTPLASYVDLSSRRLAEPLSRLASTKQPRSRRYSPEKQSTRSQSRNSSPDKQSVSVRTTVSQGSTSVPVRRATMAKCSPGFVFCQTHRLASGKIP